MKKIIIIPLLALGLIACQDNTAENLVKNESNDINENEQVQENNSTNNEMEVVDVSLYDTIIDEYVEFTEMSQEEAEEKSPASIKSGAYEYFYNSGTFKGISVAYVDINDDGVEELLISLESDLGDNVLVDVYSIVDGEVVPLLTDEISEKVHYKRSYLSLIDGGKVVYSTVNGQGDKYGTIYELNEKEMEYVETYQVSTTDGDFAVIEKELDKEIDISEFDWEGIGKERERTAYDNFMNDDFSEIEGIWENPHNPEGSKIKIEAGKLSYEDGSRVNIDFVREGSDDLSSSFNLMNEDGIGGAGLFFYPKDSEIEYGDENVPSDTSKHRFFVTQAPSIDEEDIYYKVSDLED